MSSKNQVAFSVSSPENGHFVKTAVFVPDPSLLGDKHVVVSVGFFDEQEKPVAADLPGFLFSETLEAYYVYLAAKPGKDGLHRIPGFTLPKSARKAVVTVKKWLRDSEAEVGTMKLLVLRTSPGWRGKVFQIAERKA